MGSLHAGLHASLGRRVTSGSTVAYLTANQGVTISGDATGSGSTAIALTLAPSGVVPGTYALASVTTDAKGRVTSISASTATAVAASAPLLATQSGSTYALSLPPSGVTPGTYALATVVLDSFGRAVSAAAGTISETITASGDATGSVVVSSTAGSYALPLTLAAVGTAGSYNSVQVDGKSRVTSGTTLPCLSGNQPITVSGDATGTGSTPIPLTLASVMTAGTYAKVAVDAKGRVIGSGTLAVADVAGAAPLASPTFSGTPTAPTPAVSDNSTALATTAYVSSKGEAFAPTSFTYTTGGISTIPVVDNAGGNRVNGTMTTAP